MPAAAASLTLPALDQLRDQPEPDLAEHLDLLQHLADVPDPRDPRGVRHTLALALALAATPY